jgi:hypothetical protein
MSPVSRAKSSSFEGEMPAKWPNFFFHPVPAGKNAWLAVQGSSIAFYVMGLVFAFVGIRYATQRVIKRLLVYE